MIDTISQRAERLSAGMEIIRSAGALALDYFSRYQSLDVQTKTNAQDLFSEADTRVEQLIRSSVLSRFADDGLLGEEYGSIPGTSGYQWVIDPIDGTSCFLFGLPTWCVVICLLEDGKPVVGLTYDACRDQLYSASLGEGAFCNGRPITVHPSATIENGLTAIGGSNAAYSARVGKIIERVLAAGGSYMRNGSTALTLAHVAAGHYVGYFQPLLNSWDCLAGLLLVSEAGGETNDFLDQSGILGQGDVFAACPQVAAELRQMVGDSAPL